LDGKIAQSVLQQITLSLSHSLFSISSDGMLPRYYFRSGPIGKVHVIQVVTYALLAFGLATSYRTYQPYFRGVFLATSLPTVVRDVKVLWQMLPELLNVLALLAVFITFYAWFGVSLGSS
jgi:amino acid transporter